MAVGGDTSLPDLNDLETELNNFKKSEWKKFGSKAGLNYSTLDEIEADKKGNIHQCFVECLSCWLRRKDNVDSKGKPSWRRLVEILEELGERTLADEVRGRKGEKKGISSHVHEEQQVSPVPAPAIFLTKHLKKKYNAMIKEFGAILGSFVDLVCEKRETLDKLRPKMIYYWPEKKEEIDKLDVHSSGGLMYLIRSHCSSWNFDILTSLTEEMEMTIITKKLNQFEEKQKEIYKEILAKDFARSAIEYCGTTGSKKVTFEVTWDIDETTLKDFKKFLQDVFSSSGHYMYIHLSTIHNSLLTFVCVIPHWLVDKMKDYIKNNEKLFISTCKRRVVEITVDGAIVFSVKQSLEPHQLSLENEEKEKESLQSEEEAEEEYMDQHYTLEDNRSGEGYACLMFYEKNSFIYFTAVRVKTLTALLEYIKDHHRFAEIGPIHYFHFKWSTGFIELNFNKKPSTGWTVIPLIKPCRLYQEDIDSFDGTDDSIPPYCFISFQGSPAAVPTLHYPIPLVGVADPATLFIHRTLKRTAPPAAPYTGLVYHEKKEDQHLIIFAVARHKDISNAVNCIEDQYPLARINQLIGFDFDSNHDHIELILDAPQDQSITGWTIEPHSTKLLKDQADRFSLTKTLPPSCLVSFYSSPDAVSTLQYSVPLEGVADPKTIDLLLKSPMTSSQVSYVGLIYYEWKGKEYLMTFTASKKLNRLLEYIEEYHPLAEIGQVYDFSFSSSSGCIKLLFNDYCKGWTVQPLVEPCRLYQDDIDRFDEAIYPLPPFCLVSVYGSPGADPSLHYSIPLEGVANPVTLSIDRNLQLEKEILKLIAIHEDTCTFKKEKQELLEGVSEILTLLKEQKQLESSKLFHFDVSKLEIILEPMADLWYQLGNQLNVEVEEIQESEETKDTKEQMRSLLQLCSDEGVTILQLEEALEALDQKNLIPGLQELSKEIESNNKEEQQLKSETKADEWKSIVANHINELKKQVEEQHFKEKQITKELKSKVTDNERYTAKLLKEREQLQERVTSLDFIEKQLTEDYERLKATVSDKEVYISEIEEEKKQLEEEKEQAEEEKRQLEEQYLKEKQITEELKAQVADKELAKLEKEKKQNFTEVQSTSVKKAVTYTGLVYYEAKGIEDLVTFTAAKNLDALTQFIERKHPQAMIGSDISFSFKFPYDFIELNFTAQQDEPFTGWMIKPHTKPSRLHQEAIDNFGDEEHCYPSCCLISVYGSPDAVPFLNYSIPLEGVAHPVSLNIHRARRIFIIHPPSTVRGSTSVSSTGGASPSATVDVYKVKKVINDVLVFHYAALTSLSMEAVSDFANNLFTYCLVNNAVKDNPSIEKCITEFKTGLSFKRKLSQVQEHCQKLLNSFFAVGGSYANIAIALGEDWIEAIGNELGFDFNIDIDD